MGALLRRMAKARPLEVARALYIEANLIMTESKRLVPVAPDGGTLRASGTVDEPVIDGGNISVEMSYGGAAQAYAIAVHEHLSAHSPPSWIAAEQSGKGIDWSVPGTGPKFLEIPLNKAQSEIGQRLARRLKL